MPYRPASETLGGAVRTQHAYSGNASGGVVMAFPGPDRVRVFGEVRGLIDVRSRRASGSQGGVEIAMRVTT